MKKVVVLLTNVIFLSSQLAYSSNNTLPMLIPKDDLEILQQRKEYEKYEWKSKVKGLKDQYEIDKQIKTIQKKQLKRSSKTEDIRIKELTEAEKMYKYYIPIQGVIGNVAITQNDIALVERSYIGPYPITQISIRHIKVNGQPMRMYKEINIDDIREKSLAEGTQNILNIEGLGGFWGGEGSFERGINVLPPPLPSFSIPPSTPSTPSPTFSSPQRLEGRRP